MRTSRPRLSETPTASLLLEARVTSDVFDGTLAAAQRLVGGTGYAAKEREQNSHHPTDRPSLMFKLTFAPLLPVPSTTLPVYGARFGT